MTDRLLCGWRVRSALPVPELAPCDGRDGEPEIEILAATLPASVGRRPAGFDYIERAADGAVLLDVSPEARFLVRPDRIVVELGAPTADGAWRMYLLGPVLGLLCYLRGLLPLHASAVAIGGRAVAFAGPSGAGKSTLAAALAGRGRGLVADDVCVFDPESGLVRPSFPALKLCGASAEALGMVEAHAPGQEDTEAFYPALHFDSRPIPLAALYRIEDVQDGQADRILPLGGTAAFERLGAEIYWPELGRILVPSRSMFAMVARLAAGTAARRLIRRKNFETLSTLVQRVEADAMDAERGRRAAPALAGTGTCG